MEAKTQEYLIEALSKAGDFENAEKILEEIERENKVKLLLHKAIIEQYKRNFQQADECLSEALSLAPEDLIVLKAKADSSAKCGFYSEALKVYDIILELDGKNLEIINKKAVLLEKIGKRQEAINCYDTIVQLNPTDNFAKEQMNKLIVKLITYA